jgi:hypothetical protein
MWVIGVLGVLMAGFTAIAAWLMTPEFIATMPNAAQFRRQMDELQAQANMSWDMMRRVLLVTAIFMAVPAVLFIVLGFFVRAGRRGAVIFSLVLSVLVTAFLAFQGIGAAAMGGGGAPQAVCFTLVGVGLLILLCNWLWQAVKAAPLVEAMRYAASVAPGHYAWPTPPAQPHVPTYAPPGPQSPAFTQNALPPLNSGQPPGSGTTPLYAGVMQPPMPPPGYVPSSGAPTGRPVVYGYAQAPQDAQPPPGTSPAVAEPTVHARDPASAARESDPSKQTEG